MLLRNTIRITSITSQIFRTWTAARYLKKSYILSSRNSTLNAVGFMPRFYSQVSNVDNLPEVNFEYVKRASSDDKTVIIDVREPDEIKEHGKIPNSINIPLGAISSTLALSEKAFEQTFKKAKPKENTEIIFYCMIGKRSAKAQQNAFSMGFKNVKNYLGSWTDWNAKTM